MLTSAELVWLLAAVAKGDQAAFERLYSATRAKLYGVTLRILRRADLADEVIQETYLKIWGSAGQFDPALASPITWMVAIARNRAIDLIRKKADVSLEEVPEVMEVAADTPEPLAAREMTEELKRLLGCIGRLDAERRKLVLLAYYNGWSREQLAKQFGKPVNSIKTWLRRSLIEIRAVSDHDDGRRPYRARRRMGARHARRRRTNEGRSADRQRAGVRGAGARVGAPARRTQCHGRAGRAAGGSAREDQGAAFRRLQQDRPRSICRTRIAPQCYGSPNLRMRRADGA